MQPAVRKPLVFGVIVAVHVLAVAGLAQLRPGSESMSVQTPLTVRMISQPSQPEAAKPIEVKVQTPNITIQPPEVPLLELPAVVEPSERAITIPVRTSTPVLASEDRSAPKLISTVEYLREPIPRYPPQSRKLREQGLVMLRVLIDERGNACSIEIESSSGHARLDHAAREAVSRAAFRPYVEDGSPRRAMVLIPIEFSLSRTSA
jgi:periplasmic protein TonB